MSSVRLSHTKDGVDLQASLLFLLLLVWCLCCSTALYIIYLVYTFFVRPDCSGGVLLHLPARTVVCVYRVELSYLLGVYFSVFLPFINVVVAINMQLCDVLCFLIAYKRGSAFFFSCCFCFFVTLRSLRSIIMLLSRRRILVQGFFFKIKCTTTLFRNCCATISPMCPSLFHDHKIILLFAAVIYHTDSNRYLRIIVVTDAFGRPGGNNTGNGNK